MNQKTTPVMLVPQFYIDKECLIY